MREAPLREDRSATADDAGHPLRGHRDVAQQHSSMNGEVIDALFGLFDQRVAEPLQVEFFGSPPSARSLVDRHAANRYWCLRRFASRVSGMFWSVDRSITVSPPQRVAQNHFLDFFFD